MDKEYLISIAKYIIEGHTIEEATIYFRKSRTSINNYLRLLRTDPVYYDHDIINQLNASLERNSSIGKQTGGKKSHKKYIISEEEAINYANMIMTDNLTYRDLEEITGISYATIYQAIRRIRDREVLEKLKAYYEQRKAKGR